MTSKSEKSARERILETAHQLFYSNGILATGINQIIAEAGVTKVTFYRHFPSKNDLVFAFLEFRHNLWIQWFDGSLASKINQLSSMSEALANTLSEWFKDDHFRGCAFINTSIELASKLPETLVVIKRHKRQMVEVISHYLNKAEDNHLLAQQIAMLIDGAIVMAQRKEKLDAVIDVFQRNCSAILREV